MSELIQHDNASPAASPKPKFPRPSRRWKSPSKREMWIFKRIEIEGAILPIVARDAGVSRSRVSQIVSRVRRFLAQAAGDDPRIENPLARQRLELELEKLRIEFALDAAICAIKSQPVHLVTRRSGSREKYGGKEEWNETVTRSPPPSVSAINTFLRATSALGKLNQRRIEANPVDQQLTSVQAFQAIADILSNWCARPPSDGEPPTPSFIALVEDFKDKIRHCIWSHIAGLGPLGACLDHSPECEDNHADDSPNQQAVSANHLTPETNHQTTPPDSLADAATSAATRGSAHSPSAPNALRIQR